MNDEIKLVEAPAAAKSWGAFGMSRTNTPRSRLLTYEPDQRFSKNQHCNAKSLNLCASDYLSATAFGEYWWYLYSVKYLQQLIEEPPHKYLSYPIDQGEIG